MKRAMLKTRWWMVPVATCVLGGAIAQTLAPESQAMPSLDIELIRGKLEAVGETAQADPARQKLAELYKETLAQLLSEQEHAAARDAFTAASLTASTTAKEIRRSVEHSDGDSPIQLPHVTESTSLDGLEKMLETEKAKAIALEAELKDILIRVGEEAKRPAMVRDRLTEIEQLKYEIDTELQTAAMTDGQSDEEQAQRWLLEARGRSTGMEIDRLRRELLSQVPRMELLDAQRHKAEQSVEVARARVAFLEQTLNQRRLVEAERAQAEAHATQREAVGKHPLVEDLAKKNSDLSEKVSEMAARLDEINAAAERARTEGKAVETKFASAKHKLEVGGVSQALGRLLAEQRRNLPEVRSYRKEARLRESHVADISLLQIQHNEELRSLRHVNEYLDKYTSGLSAEEIASIEPELTELVGKRIALLNKALSVEDAYLRDLGELDFVQRELLDVVDAYNDFLARWLLWIRTAPPASLQIAKLIPHQLADLLSGENWAETLNTLWMELVESPAPIVVLFLVLIIWWQRRELYAVMIATGRDINRPRVDSLGRTILGLLLVLVLALPLPLLMFTLGLLLQQSLEGSDFSRAVGAAAVYISPFYLELNALRILCARRGVAAVHFNWPESRLDPLRSGLRRLMLIFLPGGFIASLLIISDRYAQGGGLGRIALTLAMLALAHFFFRLLDPRQAPGHGFVASNIDSVRYRLRHLWAALGVAIPLIVILLSLAGYLYSAGWLVEHLVESVWLVIWLIITYAVLVRWLVLSRRRLAFQAAQQRREAARLADESAAGTEVAVDRAAIDIEEPELDLVALGADSRKLLRTLLFVIGFISLWVIWQDTLPALRVFEDIQLWSYTTSVTGEERQVPVTLADLVLAILIAILTIAATQRSASFLEILLLQRLEISSGIRYTITTLTNYTIVAVGIALIFGTLGGSWSEIRWIFAALGVGIGFGLQEIVANFISGLIILFERPIRVGDVVTVGNTDGVVTRIRIRATTIRNWERKELLVPNKEFITGRLLNWSLSDQVTRILIPVGIAYGSDVEKAMALMEEAARENNRVLDDPKALVSFEQFGDNALMLYLRSYVDSIDIRLETITALHLAINNKLAEAGIEISFPQRDVHLDTRQPLDIRISRDQLAGGKSSRGDQ